MDNKKKIYLLIVIILLIISIGLSSNDVVSSNTSPDDQQFTEIHIGVTYDPNSSPSVYTDNSDMFFLATKNGLQLINKIGEVQWEFEYNMRYPIMIGNEDKVAVSDKDSNIIYVFNKYGEMYTSEFEGKVKSFYINKNGYLGVIIMEDSGNYRIQVLDNTGFVIWDGPITDPNVIPTMIALSDDNKIMAYSTININELEMQSEIIFNYISEEDSKKNGGTSFSTQVDKGHVIGMIKYVNNELIAISDGNINRYTKSQGGTIVNSVSIPINNKIQYVDISKKGNIGVVLGSSTNKRQIEVPSNTLELYNQQGSKTGSIQFNEPITYLDYTLDTAIVGTERTFYGVNFRGDIVWEYNFTKDVEQLLYLDDEKTLIVVGNTEVTLLEKK